jgi:hypothetical protein
MKRELRAEEVAVVFGWIPIRHLSYGVHAGEAFEFDAGGAKEIPHIKKQLGRCCDDEK